MNTNAYEVVLPERFPQRESKNQRVRFCDRCRVFIDISKLTGVIGLGELCPTCLHKVQSALAAGEGKLEEMPEAYQAEVRHILKALSKKSNCKDCYGRGYIGYDYQGLPVVCHRCVNGGYALIWWKEFVNVNPPLHRLFQWLVGEEVRPKQGEPEAGESQDPGQTHRSAPTGDESRITMEDINAAEAYVRSFGE